MIFAVCHSTQLRINTLLSQGSSVGQVWALLDGPFLSTLDWKDIHWWNYSTQIGSRDNLVTLERMKSVILTETEWPWLLVTFVFLVYSSQLYANGAGADFIRCTRRFFWLDLFWMKALHNSYVLLLEMSWKRACSLVSPPRVPTKMV